MSPSIVCIVFIILHLHLKHILSFVVWIDRLLTHNEKSPPQEEKRRMRLRWW